MKTVCLLGPNLPPFFMDTHPESEAIEKYAIDLWNAGFGVIAPHLNAPRADGLIIDEQLKLNFESRVIHDFADAIFVMPGWENDETLWVRAAIASEAKKPIFESIAQIFRWKDNKPFAYLEPRFSSIEKDFRETALKIQPVKIAFVIGKYFVGERKNNLLIPDRNAIHDNILVANRIAVMLWREGIAAFTPHNNTHHFELKTRVGEPEYQAFDQLLLERLVDGNVVADNWVNSTGGKKEVAKAQAIGKPIINSYDIQSIRNWRDGNGNINLITTVTI